VGSPLLEEESYPGLFALLSYLPHPLRVYGTRACPAFATNNDPVNAPQIEAKRPQKRLAREKAHLGWHFAEIVNPVCPPLVLHRYAHPNVLGPRQTGRQLHQSLRSLRQYLERVPACLAHDLENGLDELARDVLVEQIAHRVDEDQPRRRPPERLL
jgi:hypothetical protein